MRKKMMDWLQLVVVPITGLLSWLAVLYRGLNKRVHDHDTSIALLEQTCTSLDKAIDEARDSRAAIYTEIKESRQEITQLILGQGK